MARPIQEKCDKCGCWEQLYPCPSTGRMVCSTCYYQNNGHYPYKDDLD